MDNRPKNRCTKSLGTFTADVFGWSQFFFVEGGEEKWMLIEFREIFVDMEV